MRKLSYFVFRLRHMQIIKGGSRNTYDKGIQPLVSIVIVTYNAEVHLRECLNSILNQMNLDFELLIFDGKSTDSTLSIINEYDNSINYWQSEPDKGIYDAMNKAIRFCKGKWMLFLGADDRLLHGFSEMLNQLIDARTIYYGDCMTSVELYGGKFSAYKVSKRNICQQGIFYTAEVFKKYTFNVKYAVFADYLLNIQCWGDPDFKKKYIPLKIAAYNLNGYSSFASDDAFKKDKALFVKKYLGIWIYLRYTFRKAKSLRKGDKDFF